MADIKLEPYEPKIIDGWLLVGCMSAALGVVGVAGIVTAAVVAGKWAWEAMHR